jgi:hypothetical protein
MKHQFFHAVVFLVLATVGGSVAGCENDPVEPFEVQLVTSPPSQSSTCPSEGVAGLDKTTIRTVRLTFFDSEAGEPSLDSFLCDMLIDADESGSVFYLETPKTTRLTVWAEAFGEPAAAGDATPLVASGLIDDLPFSGTVDTPSIFMALTGRMGCSLGSLSKARAFHTVTPLPGGFALVAGGLVATNGDVTAVAEGSGLLLTDEIEIYSVQTGRFVQPEIAGAEGIPRAFHSAFLVDGSDANTARVLLVGGVSQGTVPFGNGVVKIRTSPEQPLRFTPDPGAAGAPPMLLSIDLTGDPPVVTRSTDELEGWPESYFQASAYYSDTGACVMGGAAGVAMNGDFMLTADIDLGYTDSAKHYPLRGSMGIPRLGHTVSMSSDGVTGLIWGGNLGQADPGLNVAERLSVEPPPSSSSVMTLDASASGDSSPISTAFHTATVLGDDDVLIAGGFMVEASLALNPSNAVQIIRIRRNGTLFEYYPQAFSEITPVGYHAAVALPDGTVLLTGGSPLFEPGVTPCPGGENAWTCSVSQAWIYTPGTQPVDGGSVSPLPVGELQVPRFGHTMTLLSNNTVLVVGGLRRDNSTLYTEPSAEIFNAASGGPGEDGPLYRQPAGVYSAETVCPVY